MELLDLIPKLHKLHHVVVGEVHGDLNFIHPIIPLKCTFNIPIFPLVTHKYSTKGPRKMALWTHCQPWFFCGIEKIHVHHRAWVPQAHPNFWGLSILAKAAIAVMP
jgi:hypothetical protein